MERLNEGKRALVHIGAHKTGTTSIQHTLARAQREGLLSGVVYPRLRGVEKKVRAKHPFLFAYGTLAKMPPGIKQIYDGPLGRERLAEDIETYRHDLAMAVEAAQHVILSSEDLLTFSSTAIEEFRNDLFRLGVTEVIPVIYVRDPVARYLSSVQQIIKGSGTFTSPIDHRDRTLEFIHRWRRHCPDIIVRPFERSQLQGGDVVTDFIRVASDSLGVDLGVERLSPVHSNESISAEGMVILQRYRAQYQSKHEGVYRPSSDLLIRLLQRSTREIPQTKPQLDATVAAILTANHRDFFESVHAEFGFDLRPVVTQPSDSQFLLEREISSVTDILESFDQVVLDQVFLWIVHQLLEHSSGS